MSYKGLPEDLVALITPQDARTYARANGWRRVPDVEGDLALFRRAESDLDQLIIPTDSATPDYARRMAEAVSNIAEVESRSAEHVLNDLLMPAADVLRFRIASAEAQKGLLPLEEGINLLEGARRSLLAAACSVLAPGRYHPRMARTEAQQLLQACRLGQTERGSFTVTLACPLAAVESDLPLIDQTPFARKTTTLLLQSVDRIVKAIESDRVDSVVTEASGQPVVSANLCEALLRMRPPTERSLLSLSVTWARTLAQDESAHVPGEIKLRHEYFTVVEEVYRKLRPAEEPHPTFFAGYVDTLNGDMGDDGRVQGEVTLRVLYEDEEELARVRLDLGPDDYDKAIDAHRAGKMVSLTGTIHARQRVHRVTDVRDFRLLSADDPTLRRASRGR